MSDLVTGPVLLVGENSDDAIAMRFDHGSDRGKVEAEERMGFREGPRLEAPEPGSGGRVGAAGQVAIHRAGRVAKHQAVAATVYGIGKWNRRIEGFHGHSRDLVGDDPRPGLGKLAVERDESEQGVQGVIQRVRDRGLSCFQ